MTAPVAVKEFFHIRLRKSAKGYTFRCTCREFGRRRDQAAIIRVAESHAAFHSRRGEANSVELGALLK